MRTIPIAEISFDPIVGLMVKPAAGVNYELIYRAGNGLRWNREHSALVAYEPNRWEPTPLLRHMLSSIESECGDLLTLDSSTRWSNVEPALEAQMLVALKRSEQ